ncbi:muconate/chloromuconate family cycloisomerase [uncultured Ruegeria sp.]|uniref:muconate/chloromuconate family cycloisomerase n=1 Tax=uncultured Ruegeria sp. TaxID=259304 RepID=UPI00260C1F92|nr:muconate/chloromuconate family cycloisomerase [uncultured Ruegeria sp.]
MLHTPLKQSQTTIKSVDATILDIPFRRLQRFARMEARAQTIVLVRIRDDQNNEGIGECCVPCGPWWSGDCVESIKALIDNHLAPALIGMDAQKPIAAMVHLGRVARGASFAKAGVETALLDLLGKVLEVPISTLLGGALRFSCPVAWPVASGSEDSDCAEIEQKLADGQASAFKMKLGADTLDQDLARTARMKDAIGGRARLIVDPNEGWTEAQALTALPKLAEIGVDLIEQPLRRDLPAGLTRLPANLPIPVMADEGVCSESETLRLVQMGGAQVLSLKIMKSGGITSALSMGRIAHLGGIVPYLGTFLESSVGSAAGLQMAAALPDLSFGGEIVGPMLLAQDIVVNSINYADGAAHVPAGPGLGVTLDEDAVRSFTRE